MIYFENRLIIELIFIQPHGGKICKQIIFTAADDLCQIGRHLGIAGLIFLIHHHACLQHQCSCFIYPAGIGSCCTHRQPAISCSHINVLHDLGVDLIGSILSGHVGWCGQGFFKIGHVAPELPEPVGIVSTQKVGFRLVLVHLCFGHLHGVFTR